MSRHRFNNVQVKALPGGLMAHREPEADGGQPTTQKMPMWPSERIAPGGSGAFHSAKVEYSKETADLIRCKFWTEFDQLRTMFSEILYLGNSPKDKRSLKWILQL